MKIIDTYFNSNHGFCESRSIAIGLLKAVTEILNEEKITHFLISGTLLGYVRHHDFIPWDDDIDLLVDHKIIAQLPEIAKKHQDKITIFHQPHWRCFKVSGKQGIEIPDNPWKKHVLTKSGKHLWPCLDCFTYTSHRLKTNNKKINFFVKDWPAEEFFPLKKTNFVGVNVNIPNNPDCFLRSNYGQKYMEELRSSNFSHKNETPIKKVKPLNYNDYLYGSEIRKGVDAKVMQYSEHAPSLCHTQINLKSLLDNLIKSNDDHYILINLEKDEQRYHHAVEELKKISVNSFFHLKGTDGRKNEILKADLIFILKFLKQFNENINPEIEIDEFSEISDKNIYLQGGPLGCFCSHIRALIYGYLNFKDYTIVVEDDIVITNTDHIKNYIKEIPDDWDVICLNAAAKNIIYDKPVYKFTNEWHSTHFTIYRNRCLPYLFSKFYPITDQIDVLVSDQTQHLNIYNIPHTVYQKNISTNTQNNLHVIFNSPHYHVVRNDLDKIESLCEFFIETTLPNCERKKILSSHLMYDVLYNYITKTKRDEYSDKHDPFVFDDSKYTDMYEYQLFIGSIARVINCSKKGINSINEAKHLANVFLYTIQKFDLHGTIDEEYQEELKAYDFGSSAHTYRLEKNDIILKKYNEKLRWATKDYENCEEIFADELQILQATNNLSFVPKLLNYNLKTKTLKLSYEGESLHNDFNLPPDWKNQIKTIFQELNSKGVFYPEFRLENILVKNGKIKLIDFGMAKLNHADNQPNCEKFIKILSLFEKKFKDLPTKTRHELCHTFYLTNAY